LGHFTTQEMDEERNSIIRTNCAARRIIYIMHFSIEWTIHLI